MLRILITVFVLVVAATACAGAVPNDRDTETLNLPREAEQEAPSAKQVVKWVLSNADVPLTVDPSCSGVGTDASDITIGDYLSGFLAEFAGSGGVNRLESSCKRDTAGGIEGSFWTCDLLVRRADGEDEWGWGVQFKAGISDHVARKDSFRCLGSG